ncbi:ATP-binding protein [Streptomyces sp. 21So2-11]|uniref:ATP-binding protein n=1 Tax=Streptomyces sp. 21So2-11 TaxID=3144408 RepID=UPI003219E7AA
MTVSRQDFEDAMAAYWGVKQTQTTQSKIMGAVGAGTAGAVRGGKHFDVIADLLAKSFEDAGYPWQYELGFPCDPRSPRIARTTVRTVLDAHHLNELGYRAELLVSELVTNSVQHTKGPAAVRLHWLHPVLRGSVWDMSPDLPRPVRPAASIYDEAGRGLAILDLVADRWGGCAIGDGPYGPGGKTIWFELALAAAPPPLTP